MKRSILVAYIALALCGVPRSFGGAVGGPQTFELSLGYYSRNTDHVQVEFEGGKEARISTWSTLCGYGVITGPGVELVKKFARYGSEGRCGGVATFTPSRTAKYTIEVINDDNDAKKDAVYHIETN